MRKTAKISNFALPIFWEPELLTAQEMYEERAAKAEYDAEMAYERHLETNDQYRWEVEEDERRAMAWL